ncbi:mRNA 3'-end-processing protein YTH1 [Ceratocystis fimbriata CBS 114723]|uniref:mRNA 3'-end-processing protein n=2 Tax=Ceratocystis TaxID=5157 RepID=A0A2C5WZQ4_9PEZI|nr:mRNA 3'-end-processing protein YTH1 [Ceratocystis fimbriata CBS 114723]
MAMSTSISQLAADVLANNAPAYSFNFSPFLRLTHHHGLPADRPICKSYAAGTCPNGTKCLERHVSDPNARTTGPTGGLNSLVCKHWLRGLCKKGEQCEFLHEYNLRKMPECNFFSRNGFCSNGEECLYLHIDPQKRMLPCPHYERGYCPLGPDCSKRHLRRTICPFYLAGFCPEGRECTLGVHPKWNVNLERPTRMADKLLMDEALAAQRRAEMEREEAEKARMGGGGYDREDTTGRGGFRHGMRGRGKWRGRGGGTGHRRGQY